MSEPTESESPSTLLYELARESLIERRRARRWSIFFRTVMLALIVGVAWTLFSNDEGPGPSGAGDGEADGHTALIRIEGLITADSPASIEPVRQALERAIEDPRTRGILLEINSPGGSPVQSGLMHDVIVEHREAHPDTPIHAVIGDVAASGGYYVAAAAENIYANRASIVGSIGVRLDSFGAVEALERLGIERRLLTAGEHKGLLDPFEPVDDIALQRLQTMLDTVHAQFIDVVKTGRGDRLIDDPTLFSGLVWSGEEAVDNGLVDGLAGAHEVARDVVGAEALVDFTELGDPLDRLRRELGISLDAILDSLLHGVSHRDASVRLR